MKTIAFFTPSLNIGGIERVFITYAEALVKDGYNVSYIISHEKGILTSLLHPNINLVSLGGKRLRNSIFPLIRFLKNNSFDILITGGDFPNALALIITRVFKIKTEVIISHHNYFNVERNSYISKIIFKYIYNFSNKIICVSTGIKDMLLENGVKEKNIYTLYNPINIHDMKRLGEMDLKINLPLKYLIFVGRLGEVKNLTFLIDSYEILHKKDSTIDLVIVGDGQMSNLLKDKVVNLNLQNSIHFFGELSNPFPLIKKSLGVVLTSYSEALPTIILEGFVFNKTVISTPTMGAIDLLESGRFGYISKSFDDAEEFASTIEKGLLNPISPKLIVSKVKIFSINRKIKELENLIETKC